jgi:hypothetical protein
MSSAITWYSNVLRTRPIVSKSASAIFIFGVGDYLCQVMELRILKKPGKIDIKRILKQSLFGFVVAPYLHLQYCQIIPKLFPGENTMSLIKSTVYAVTISDSLFNFSYFYFMNMCNSNKISIDSSTTNEVMQKFIPVQINNLKIWPILTGINFFLVPIQFRVLFDNILGIFWNIYLSWVEYNK